MSDWEVAGAPQPIDTTWTVAKDQPVDTSWKDVGKSALKNFLPSVGNVAKEMYRGVVDLPETMRNLGGTQQQGLRERLSDTPPPGGQYADQQIAGALKDAIVHRYGGIDNLKQTLAKDPAGFLMDVSTVLSGGETGLAKLPGIAGKVGKVAGETSRITNPLSGPAKMAAHGAETIAPGAIGELATHTGADSLAEAAKAGYQGGSAQKKLMGQMTGRDPSSAVVDEALKGTKAMRKAMTSAYNRDIGPILRDPHVLDFQRVKDAIYNAEDIQTFSGYSGTGPTISLDTDTSLARAKIKKAVDEFETKDPREYHTIAGFDALKKKIGKIYRDTEPNTPDRVLAGKIYTAVKNTIGLQDPRYGKVMSEYEDAIDGLNEVEKELSLGEKATYGTSLRKLQSIMRNNASTANRHRKELGEALVEAGAGDLMPMLAGQALEPRFARGLGRLVPTAIGGGAVEAAMSGQHSLAAGLGMAAGATAISSPRLMGQTANKLGMAARPFKYVPPDKASLSLFQAGRMASPLDNIVEQGLTQPPQPTAPTSE